MNRFQNTTTYTAEHSLAATETFSLFDTHNRISLPEEHRDLLPELREMCERFEALFSPSLETSDVCRIGRSGAVSVAPETAELVSLALRLGEATEGLFDITLGGAARLWDLKHRSTLPEQDELESAVSAASLGQLRVVGCTILAPVGCRIDLGGIAKGFIADRLAQRLLQAGVPRAIIDLGGNLYLAGLPEGRTHWQIGIRDPGRPDGRPFALLRCGGGLSVVTSASSERYAVIGGKRYHHLLDPKTGMPADSNLRSVTILCKSSALADALATACFVGGHSRAGALLRRFRSEGVEAILLGMDGRCFVSAGLTETDAVRLL